MNSLGKMSERFKKNGLFDVLMNIILTPVLLFIFLARLISSVLNDTESLFQNNKLFTFFSRQSK
ncbi:MAG: hypothetical protein PHV30_10655 [Candidatus Margulisbacteria bacterium]|nr:hypothetical protein [Candidatus Margulisiibacteriota bacterium]